MVSGRLRGPPHGLGVESQWFLTKAYSNWHSIDAVIKVGKAHGAQAEDIYGCLYFFLSQELRTFSRRVRQFRIAFKLHCWEACELSLSIRDDHLSAYGLPASIRFDRIEVSNILDANYVGMRAVLTHWAPLLAESTTAAIVGYFMNWVGVQRDGKASEAGPSVIAKLFRQTMERRKVRKVTAHRSRSRVAHELHFKLNLKIRKLDSSRSL